MRSFTFALLIVVSALLNRGAFAESFQVYDAAGRQVGTLLSSTPSQIGGPASATVVLNLADQQIAFGVHRRGFQKLLVTYFGFESTDCSGTPLFAVPPDQFNASLFVSYGISRPGSTVYIPDPTDAGSLITTRSRSTQVDGTGICDSGSVITARFVNAVSLGDLDIMFTPPFSILQSPPPPTLAAQQR